MKIEQINIRDLKEYEKNTKKHPKDQVAKIAKSIEQFGFNVPVLIDAHNVLIAGHGRLAAARKLGLESVPALRKTDLTAEQVKAFRIADNKVAESDWDYDFLREEFDFLEQANFDLELTGFDADEIEGIMPIVEEDVSVEEVEADDADTIQTDIVEGDIFTIGPHRLMCGDSTDYEIVGKQLLGGSKVDLCFTDPPYGMNAVSKSGVLSANYSSDILGDDDNTVAIKSFSMYDKIAHNHVWWGANYYSSCLPSSECWIVWDKNNGGSDQTDAELAWTNLRSVVRMYKQASEKTNRVHPTQKPVSLFTWFVNKFSKYQTKTVIDLFGGSGSTMVAAHQLKRKCYMMELDPKYCQVIINRMCKLDPDIEVKCENRELTI